MPVIELTTNIRAPVQRCFDLSRSIELHTETTRQTGEQAVAGVTKGLIGLGETVTWRAKHFGIWQQLTSRITAMEAPYHFRDEQIKGAFKKIVHDHYFSGAGDHTIMKDRFYFESPGGTLGSLFNKLVLTRYTRRFLVERNAIIKDYAEGRKGGRFLSL